MVIRYLLLDRELRIISEKQIHAMHTIRQHIKIYEISNVEYK